MVISDESIKVHENKLLAETFIRAKGDTKKFNVATGILAYKSDEKVWKKKQLNIKLCLAPFIYKFVLHFTLIPDKSNSIQPFVKLLIYENLFIDLLVENPIKVPIR